MPSGFAGKVLMGGALAAGTIAAVLRAGMRPESQLFGHALVAGKDPDEIALTYDDGPNERSTADLLAVLDRFGVRATFFMVGKYVRQQSELVRSVEAAGHLIGNHTTTHPFLANKPVPFIRDELRRCNETLEDVLGKPVQYFRAPFGARRPAVLRVARELGLTSVQWNVQGNDWEPVGVSGILRTIERGMRRTQRQGRGANILLHDGHDQQMGADRSDTVRATELLLLSAQQGSKRLVTVDAWN